MVRLNNEDWKNIFRNLKDIEDNPHDYAGEYEEFGADVGVMWLDNGEGSEGNNEWALVHGYEVFEDGFNSENEAQERLSYLEKNIK